jgi:hypothetical protein
LFEGLETWRAVISTELHRSLHANAKVLMVPELIDERCGVLRKGLTCNQDQNRSYNPSVRPEHRLRATVDWEPAHIFTVSELRIKNFSADHSSLKDGYAKVRYPKIARFAAPFDDSRAGLVAIRKVVCHARNRATDAHRNIQISHTD